VYFIYLIKQLSYRMIDSFRTIKEEGIRSGIAEFGRTIARIFYGRAEYLVLANSLSDRLDGADPQPEFTICQVTTLEEIEGLGPIADSADMARFHELFESGSMVFIASQNAEVVGYCWVSSGAGQDVNRIAAALQLEDGDAYVHDLFTSMAHRSKGVGRSLVSHRLRYLREHGYKRAVGAVFANNVPALKVNKKTGYESIGVLHHYRVLFWNHFKYVVVDS
jgi:ribosomal protein S18 acetylase RimI-like enzyme